MEFQLLSALLEDRYPPALARDTTRRDLLLKGFADDCRHEEPTVEPHVEGAIAFLFGRMDDGSSICVRVEGIRPRLYFEVTEEWSVGRILALLEKEAQAELRKGTQSGSGQMINLTHKTVQRTHLYDYEPDEDAPSGRVVHNYLEVEFPSLRTFRALRNLHAPKHAEDGGCPPLIAHETKVDPLIRVFLDAEIRPGGWCCIQKDHAVGKRVTSCDKEVLVHKLSEISPVESRTLPAPYKHCYYDIETLGLDPDASAVIQVSLVFEQRSDLEKHVVCLDATSDVEGAHVHSCATEAELLLKTRALIIEHDPDFLVTYNGVNFDNNFLATRAEAKHAWKYKIEEFFYLSRFALRPTRLRELALSSDGMGDNVLKYFETPGRENIDYFVKLKRDLPSEMSHKLGIMARKFCGDDKEDMDYREIPKLQAGTPDDRARLASYCIHDSVLLARLNHARVMTLSILQFAQVFRIPPEWVYFRGQQVRFTTQLADKARSVEAVPMILNHPALGFSDVGDGTYEGATVNDPKSGFYKLPVACLDWLSLYPSIMIAHNLCPSTMVRDPALMGGTGIVEHKVSDTMTFHFAVATRQKGVLPFILEELMQQRGVAKKEVKKHLKLSKQEDLDPEIRAQHKLLSEVYDGKQLAIKVSCNSVYGAEGASWRKGAPYPCMGVSATTTFRGRDAMVIKKEFLPRRFPGIDIIYGDSVAEYTPMLVRLEGQEGGAGRVAVVTPQELWAWTTPIKNARRDKEAALITGVSTWTERGWTPITTILRHRAGKPMYRVATPTGVVDVTEDHSLLRPDGSPCTARECQDGGGDLLHSWPPVVEPKCIRPEDTTLPAALSFARILGFFVGDGSCGCHQGSSGIEYTWEICNANLAMLEVYREECRVVFGHPFKILDAIDSSGMHKMIPQGDINALAVQFCELCYGPDKLKKIPDQILNGSAALHDSFLEGLCDSDNVYGKDPPKTREDHSEWNAAPSIEQKSERVALGLFYLLRALGFHVSIDMPDDNSRMYRIRWTRWTMQDMKMRKKDNDNDNVIQSCTRLVSDPNAYVYDLTTSNHHFHAGVGQMIVHNTDSVMVTFKDVYDVQECGNLAERAAEEVTAEFARLGYPAMILEFEKIFTNYCLFKKKRYVGNKYEPDVDGVMHFKCIDAKGVETERTDALPYLKEMYLYVREAVLAHSDPTMALARFDEKMQILIRGEVPFEKLIMGRKLSSKVVEKTDSIAHAKVNAMRREREPGSEEAVNNRVEYVIINDHKNKKTTEMAEDPVYAREHGLKLNLKWYFEHKIEKPMRTFFSIHECLAFEELCKKYKAELERERLGIKSLRDFFGPSSATGAAASSSSSAPMETPRRVHVPAPPAPRKRPKKK